MLKIFITCVLLIIGSVTSFTQRHCGVKNQYDNRPLTKQANRAIASDTTPVSLPVQVYIVRNDDGSGGLTGLPAFGGIVNQLDIDFAHLNYDFYECAFPIYIDRTDLINLHSVNEIDSLVAYEQTQAINIYVIETFEDQFIGGLGSFPWASKSYIIVKTTSWIDAVSHEVGHYLGLLHTQSSNELVNGSNCLTAGDRLCDTPADPGLSTSNVNSNCVYTGTTTDLNGDLYNPLTDNFMSYTRASCDASFTQNQDSVMRYYLANDRSYLTCNQTTVINEIKNKELILFPNPASEQLDIKANFAIEKITIYNVSGKLIEETVNKNVLDISRYKKGYYRINVHGKTGMVMKDFIKN